MSRVAALAAVERLVLLASEWVGRDAEVADQLLGEAVAEFSSIPPAPYDDGPSLEAALQLAAAVESLTDRLEREKGAVGETIATVDSGRAATQGYASASSAGHFARLG